MANQSEPPERLEVEHLVASAAANPHNFALLYREHDLQAQQDRLHENTYYQSKKSEQGLLLHQPVLGSLKK